jgi:transcription-repair coupling factor (superfamily II helicase)
LDVLAENTHLGAGYSIAMRDLEIRGAGELLGMRQSGHIVSVGFHLYTRMLATAVKRLKNAMKSLAAEQGLELPVHLDENTPLFEEELKEPVTVELPLAIGLPSAYIPKQEMRLRIYRRIASMRDEEELIPLAMEFEDRFGPMPEMCKNLFFQMRIKLMADTVGIASVSVENNQVVLKYHNISDSIANRVLRDLSPIIRGGKNAYWCNIMKGEDWQKELIEILISLKQRTITI